jgi:uncharacterized protein (UPF0371 family)
VKIRLLQQLREKAEVLLCIYAGDIERKKIRADFGITYDVDALKLIDDLRANGINVSTVVITRFDNQPSALLFRNRLERSNIQVAIHRYTKGYPTDMGVNRAGYGIMDDGAVRNAATQEVIRRYLRSAVEYAMGLTDRESVQRSELLMKELGVSPEDRTTVPPALQAAKDAEARGKGNNGIFCGAAIELRDGTIITGKNSPLMHSASALVMNAIKRLAGLPDSIHLLPPNVIESLSHFKRDVLHGTMLSLDLEETLIALSISATLNPAAQLAIEKLKELRGCEMHLTHIPPPGDEAGLRKLGVNLTSNPRFTSSQLFQS